MALFFTHVDQDFVNEISNGDSLRDICEGWSGISCEQKIVTEVCFTNVSMGNFWLPFLPSTVKSVQIINSKQSYSLDSRLIPKDCQILNLSGNKIQGPFILKTLPQGIRHIDLSHNEIRGPFHLIGLPSRLESLIITFNLVKQKFVFYDRIPESLNKIDLVGSHDTNEIRYITATSQNVITQRKWIFCGLFHDCIDPTSKCK